MKSWKGKLFIDWCLCNSNDDRKINYKITVVSDGKHKEIKFTSEDYINGKWLLKIQDCIIISMILKNGQWFAKLKYIE